MPVAATSAILLPAQLMIRVYTSLPTLTTKQSVHVYLHLVSVPMSVWFVRLCLPTALLLKNMMVARGSLVSWHHMMYLLSSHETKRTCVCSLSAPLRTWPQRYTHNSSLCAMLKLIHTCVLLFSWEIDVTGGLACSLYEPLLAICDVDCRGMLQ